MGAGPQATPRDMAAPGLAQVAFLGRVPPAWFRERACVRGAPRARTADRSGAPLPRVEIQTRRTPSARRCADREVEAGASWRGSCAPRPGKSEVPGAGSDPRPTRAAEA